MKILYCIKCGKERTAGRRMCEDCYKEFKRNYSNERFKRLGRHNYGKMNCIVCGKEITKYRKDQLRCIKCANVSTNPSGKAYYNAYANGKGKGYCWMHRRIAEEALGRKLSSKEVVHHLDENPQNNDPSNLIVLSSSMHAKLHAFLRRAFIEQSMNENAENCWETIRVPITTAFLETNGANVIKISEIWQSAAEPLSE